MKGIIVAGHGSRSEEAKDVFLETVNSLRKKLDSQKVEGCFMELAEPYIPDMIDEMYEEGIREFTILPYFLIPGIHIKEDIPEILKEAKEKYGDIVVSLAKPIGFDERLVEILKDRATGEVVCI